MHGHLNVKMDAESLIAAKYVSEFQNISSNESKTTQVHTTAMDIAEELLIHEQRQCFMLPCITIVY